MADKTKVRLEARDRDGEWYVVKTGELPMISDHWGAELRVRKDD